MRVALVLPAYNEAECLAELLVAVERAHELRPGEPWLGAVIVVDDGSTDDTRMFGEAAADRLPMHVVTHQENRGLGAALRTGLNHALDSGDYDAIVTMDSDNTHDPQLIPLMLDRIIEGADLVVASRFARGGREIGVPNKRRLMSRGAAVLLRLRFPFAGVRDYTCGYRAYSAELLRTMRERFGEQGLVAESGFAASVELLLKARACGASATEVPLVLRYDKKLSASKMNVGRTVRRLGRVLIGTGYVSVGGRS